MKHLFIIIILSISFHNNAFTQSENGILKNEWSANLNFFVNEFLLSKNTEEDIINYQASTESIINYRRYLNKTSVWQIGGNFYRKKSDEELSPGFGEDQSQVKKGYFLRTGFQKYYHLSNQVKFYFGTDLLLSFQKYEAFIDFENVPTFFEGNYSHINREKEIGLIPHLGFRWELNSKISFSTETNLVASYVFFDIELESPFSTEPILRVNNSLQKDSESFSFKFQQPIALFLNLRF